MIINELWACAVYTCLCANILLLVRYELTVTIILSFCFLFYNVMCILSMVLSAYAANAHFTTVTFIGSIVAFVAIRPLCC